MADRDDGLHRLLIDVREEPPPEGEPYRPLGLRTARGEVAVRFYAQPGSRLGALWVGGAGGGWDTPAGDLYPRLCSGLLDDGIASLRVRFRDPHSLAEAVHDVRSGLAFLREKGLDTAALVGHSFGGAACIQAAAGAPAVRAVVALAAQSYGTDAVATLGPRCAILLVHGTGDTVLPALASQQVYEMARDPRQLVLYPGAGHGLEEVADEVCDLVRRWLTTQLRPFAAT